MTTTSLTSAFAHLLHDSFAQLRATDLLTLWEQQLRGRAGNGPGRFGPAGWLAVENLAPALVGGITSLPTFVGDVTQFSRLTRGSSRLLLERLPAAVLDCDEPCSPPSRVLLEAAVRHRELQPGGYVVGPDRYDERIMVDSFLVTEPAMAPLGVVDVMDLLGAHDWDAPVEVPTPAIRRVREQYEALAADVRNPEAWAGPPSWREDEGASDAGGEPGNDHDHDHDSCGHDAEHRALVIAAIHTSNALMPLWPLAVERYGITGAKHQPDEITLVSGRQEQDLGIRFWWRWGTRTGGCPSDSGMRMNPMTLAELTRRLPRSRQGHDGGVVTRRRDEPAGLDAR